MFRHSMLAICWLLSLASNCQAESLLVACAANFANTLAELAERYEERTGVQVDIVVGSTGMLYGQIQNGAEFDLFFAADMERPQYLHEQGLAPEPLVYARGRVVLWSAAEITDSTWQLALAAGQDSVAMAGPETAPYGAAAWEAMRVTGVLENVEPRLVFGKNVGQSFQFAWSGAAELAFIALSQALSDKGRTGSFLPVEQAPVVEQGLSLLGSGEQAMAFAAFVIDDPEAGEIIGAYGYE